MDTARPLVASVNHRLRNVRGHLRKPGFRILSGNIIKCISLFCTPSQQLATVIVTSQPQWPTPVWRSAIFCVTSLRYSDIDLPLHHVPPFPMLSITRRDFVSRCGIPLSIIMAISVVEWRTTPSIVLPDATRQTLVFAVFRRRYS